MNVPRPNSLVQLYLQRSDLSDQMLFAAQDKGWLTVITLGERYIETLEALRSVDRSIALTSEEKELRYRLLVRIIDNDAHTRSLMQPGDTLDRLLGSSAGQSGTVGLKKVSR